MSFGVRRMAFVLPSLFVLAAVLWAQTGPVFAGGGPVAVAPQYQTTHVYVAAENFDRLVASLVATFGGTKARRNYNQLTPTPSQAASQLVLTPVGSLSVFGYTTPIPYPFGIEQTGYLVADMDAAVAAAKKNGADIVVATFTDPAGRDAIIEWPGGWHMQLYWHKTKPDYPALQTIPENHVYVSPDRAEAFLTAFKEFAEGKVVSDDRDAPGVEIGHPNETYRRVRFESGFGKMTVLVTDGHLPFPYGRETTGYDVPDFDDTLTKAEAAGVNVLVKPYIASRRKTAILQFPGGYIAEIHAAVGK